MTERPTLSIVIVNSDGAEDTVACIASIGMHQPRAPFEIVLVDNRSRDGCLALVAARFPHVRRILAPARQGFARNYNLGMRHARGEHLLVLNNDTLLTEGALDRLLDAARANPAWGMLGPTLISPDGSIQSVCARQLPGLASYLWSLLVVEAAPPLLRARERLAQARLAAHPGGPVACISGACMLVRRSAVERAGMLDEGFDFYFEDVEWCHRLQRQGLPVGYVPRARVIHLGDRSLGRVKVWAKQSELRSALRYFARYGPRAPGPGPIGGGRGAAPSGAARALAAHALWLAAALSFLSRGLGALALEALTGRPRHARAYLYLWWWVLRPDVYALARESARGDASVSHDEMPNPR